MERNVELLEKTMQFIKDHPEKHNQAEWCGTAQCFAGWAVELAGYAHGEGFEDMGLFDSPWSEKVLTTREAATDLLGLTEAEADTLFAADNTRDALELMVKDLINGGTLGTPEDYE